MITMHRSSRLGVRLIVVCALFISSSIIVSISIIITIAIAAFAMIAINKTTAAATAALWSIVVEIAISASVWSTI